MLSASRVVSVIPSVNKLPAVAQVRRCVSASLGTMLEQHKDGSKLVTATGATT
jgi:hypothetical protein